MNVTFGPIYSRRFGESLGVDLSPQYKQCNYDCLYCELEGKKAQETMEEILSVEKILTSIQEALSKFKSIECLTITANGEPTLYPHLYELMLRLEDIKGAAKTLLLTNGALLWDLNVSRACLLFDKVKFSLDAVTPEVFKKIDRPHSTINLEQILRGIYEFRQDFRGELYAEILFVKGVNDDLKEIEKMAKFLFPLFVTRLDIGTIDRPPAYKVQKVSQEALKEFQALFQKHGIRTNLPTRETTKSQENLTLNEEEILKTLALRPMSQEDIKALWDSNTQEILRRLCKEQKVFENKIDGVNFYQLTKK